MTPLSEVLDDAQKRVEAQGGYVNEWELAWAHAQGELDKARETIKFQKEEIQRLQRDLDEQKRLTAKATKLAQDNEQGRLNDARVYGQDLGRVNLELRKLKEQLPRLAARLTEPERCLEEFDFYRDGVNPRREVRDVRDALMDLAKVRAPAKMEV